MDRWSAAHAALTLANGGRPVEDMDHWVNEDLGDVQLANAFIGSAIRA